MIYKENLKYLGICNKTLPKLVEKGRGRTIKNSKNSHLSPVS